MKKIILFVALSISWSVTNAQDTLEFRKMFVLAKVITMNDRHISGYLHSVTDSDLNLSVKKARVNAAVAADWLNKINVTELRSVELKSKGTIKRGIILGSIMGVILGAIIGRSTYNDPGPDAWIDFGPGYSAATGALIGLGAGGLIGLSIGAMDRPKFVVGGRQDNYRLMQIGIKRRITVKHRK